MKKFGLIISLVLAVSLANCKESANDSGAQNATAPSTAVNELGKAKYMATCATCHGPQGLGDGPAGVALKARNFKTDAFKNGNDIESIKNTITNGLPKTQMVSFKAQLTPEEIQAVAEYVKYLSGK